MSTNELHERIYAPYATAASSASASAGTRAPPTSCSPAAVPPRSSYAALLLAPSSSCSGWDPPTATPHWPMSSTPPATAPAQGGPSMSRPCAGYATPTTCPHPHPSRPAGLLWVSAQPQSTRRDRRDPLLGHPGLSLGVGCGHRGVFGSVITLPPAVAEDVEQATVGLGNLDTQAFSSPGADMDGTEFAALDTLQHRLPRDPQRHGGLQHRQPPLGGLLDEPAAVSVVPAGRRFSGI
jgi:hypothetical protein